MLFMRNILPVFIVGILLLSVPLYAKANEEQFESKSAYEEVILETEIERNDGEDIPEDTTITEEIQEKSLKEKLNDVYNLEVYKYDKPSYLFGEILTHKYPENSFLETTHIWGAYSGDIGVKFIDDGTVTNHYDFNAVNIGFDGVLKDKNADFRIMMGFPPRSHRNFTQTMFADIYVGTNKVPHHRFLIGYKRPQVGMEGGNSSYTLPFINRSQIARTFGTARKLGAKVEGDYSLIDYDLGVYSSSTYFQEFFPGAEFIGWINLKPLGKTNGKYGNLKIGGGLDAGHRSNDFCVIGSYVGYEYKKFMVNFEWSQGNGYNGPLGESVRTHAGGFCATIGYMLTKKLQILARYDEFDPNKHINSNKKREFSMGLNYFIKGQALKLVLDYIFCQNDNAHNSHRILLGTQILL